MTCKWDIFQKTSALDLQMGPNMCAVSGGNLFGLLSRKHAKGLTLCRVPDVDIPIAASPTLPQSFPATGFSTGPAPTARHMTRATSQTAGPERQHQPLCSLVKTRVQRSTLLVKLRSLPKLCGPQPPSLPSPFFSSSL